MPAVKRTLSESEPHKEAADVEKPHKKVKSADKEEKKSKSSKSSKSSDSKDSKEKKVKKTKKDAMTPPDSTVATPDDTGSEAGSEESDPNALENFRISKESMGNLRAAGIKALFPIQVMTFDHVYDGKDVVAQAKTGSGKTISFGLPLIEKLLLNPPQGRGRPPTVIVMAPTRELAKQIENEFGSIIGKRSLATCCIYGGAPYEVQERAMKSGVSPSFPSPLFRVVVLTWWSFYF